MCSTILAASDETITKNVNETIINTTNVNGTISSFISNKDKALHASRHTTEKLLDKLDVTTLRKAGMFLKEPECRVYLSGFNEHQQMQLQRCLKSAGAVSVNELTSSVTHVIVNHTLPVEQVKIIEMLKLNPHFVSLQWLVESLQMGMAVSESDFNVPFPQSKQKDSDFVTTISLGDTIGPLPKPGKEALEFDTKKIVNEKPDDNEDQMEDDIIAQYAGESANSTGLVPSDDKLKDRDYESMDDTTISFKIPINALKDTMRNVSLSENNEQSCHISNAKELSNNGDNEVDTNEKTLTQIPDSENAGFFSGKIFLLVGFDKENTFEFSECVKEVGGKIVSNDFEGDIDFLIVPPTVDRLIHQNISAKKLVSSYWLEDCLEQGIQLKPQYYHSPINSSQNDKPCTGVVIGITGYCGKEREFIHTVAEALGMISQEIFAKRDKKGALRSTHLICALPEGAKYEAGIKWELPVVTKDWLLACLHYNEWISEKAFLVGDATKYTVGKVERLYNISYLDKENETKHLGHATTKIKANKANENFDTNNVPENLADYKTPKSTRSATLKDLETPYLPILERNKINRKPVNFILTPDVDSFSKLPPESQPSPSTSKRKREDDAKLTPYLLRNIKTPETPYGAFLEKNPSRETRKFWKLQCDELGRFEYTKEQRAELEAKKERVAQYAKECEEEREKCKMDKEYEEYFKHALDPDRTKEMHIRTFKKYGVPILEQGSKTFDELMEEKMQRQGISWKNPKRFKLQHHDKDSSNGQYHNLVGKEDDMSKDDSKDSAAAAEQLSAQLAKFNELAQMNSSNANGINVSLQMDGEKERIVSDNKSKRKSSIKMTLSSIEVESDRGLNVEGNVEVHDKSNSNVHEINSESQIRWVNPKEEEERKKLAARLALESQDISEENQSYRQVKTN